MFNNSDYEKTLLNILPTNYKYVINRVAIREENEIIPTEVKLEAEFRVSVGDGPSFDRFLSDFSQSSGTSYNKVSGWKDRSGKRALIQGVRKCIHNVKEKKGTSELNKDKNKTGKMKEPGKNTECPAEMNLKILKHCESLCATNTHKNNNEYPLEVILYYNHNHAIQAADAMRFQPVSEETKNMFIKLFDEDLSPSSAYRRVLDFLETDAESFAKLYNVPDYKWVYNFHGKYVKDEFGSANGPDVFEKVREKIKFNEARGNNWQKSNKQRRVKLLLQFVMSLTTGYMKPYLLLETYLL